MSLLWHIIMSRLGMCGMCMSVFEIEALTLKSKKMAILFEHKQTR